MAVILADVLPRRSAIAQDVAEIVVTVMYLRTVCKVERLRKYSAHSYDGRMQRIPRLIDGKADADLERDGYAVIPRMLDHLKIEHLLNVFRTQDSPIHRMPFGVSLFSRDVAFRATLDREIKTVVASKLESVLNSYRCCFANFVSKVPQPDGPAGEVALHQDITFVDESRYQSLGLWCPLTDVDTTNGCLHVIPGSHRLNPGPRGSTVGFPLCGPSPGAHEEATAGAHGCGKRPHLLSKAIPRIAAKSRNRRLDSWSELFAHRARPSSTATTPIPRRRVAWKCTRSNDLFYTRYILQTRPKGVRRSGEIDYWYKPLTPSASLPFRMPTPTRRHRITEFQP